MKEMTKFMIRGLTISVLAVLSFNTVSYALPMTAPKSHVHDEADVLKRDTKEFILGLNKAYEKEEKKPHFDVLTVEKLSDSKSEPYAQKVFKEWNSANMYEDNSVLILVANQERRIRIIVGRDLKELFPRHEITKLLNGNMKTFRNGNHDEAIKSVVYTMSHRINRKYEYKDILDDYKKIRKYVPTTKEYKQKNTRIIIIFIIIGFFGWMMSLSWSIYKWENELTLWHMFERMLPK